jgi:hypothetical protein
MAQAELVSIAGRARFTGALPKPSTTLPIGSPIRVAYAGLLAALAGHPPCPILAAADTIDLQDRADHLEAVLAGLTAYLAVILDDTVQSTPGGLDLSDAEVVLADLASDLTGSMLLAAERSAGGLL